MLRMAKTTVLVAPLTALGLLGLWFGGCDSPVDSDTQVTIKGRLLLPDGTPATNLTVYVQKSDVEPISFNWAIGTLVNEDVQPFLSVMTDSDGRFSFQFTGKEANAGNGLWAAYFKVYATKGDGEDPMAVATPPFTFSNQDPNRDIPDMRFIQLQAANVTIDEAAKTVKVTWDRQALPESVDKILVQVAASDWVAEVEDDSFELPLAAIEPCLASIEAGTCTPLPGDAVRVTVLTDDVLYRTNWQAFVKANPLGAGLKFTAEDDSSGTTCSGLPLYKLNDGKNDPMLVGDFGKNASQEDLKCLQFHLPESRELTWFFLHSALLFEHKQVTIKVSTSSAETPADADFTEWGSFPLANQRFWHANLVLQGPRPNVSWLRVELQSTSDKPLWFALGEVSLY